MQGTDLEVCGSFGDLAGALERIADAAPGGTTARWEGRRAYLTTVAVDPRLRMVEEDGQVWCAGSFGESLTGEPRRLATLAEETREALERHNPVQLRRTAAGWRAMEPVAAVEVGESKATCAHEAKTRGAGWTAEDVAVKRAENYVKLHPWPGLRPMAKLIGASKGAMERAVRKSEALKRAAAGAAIEAPAKTTRKTAAVVPEHYVDEALRRLIDGAADERTRAAYSTPGFRAELAGMNREDLAELVKTAGQGGTLRDTRRAHLA